MKWTKLMNAIFIGVFVYVLFSVCFGKQGLWAYKQLQEYKISITENVDTLQELNNNISIDKNSLLNSTDIIVAYAHSMGFVKENENLVKITGIKPYSNKVYSAGAEAKKQQIIFMPDWLAKFAGFSIFLLINLVNSLFLLLQFLKNSSKRMVLHTAVVISGDLHDSE